jgi:hypothetical protein
MMKTLSQEGSAPPVTGIRASWINLAIIVVIGILSLVSLYFGFQSFAEDQMTAYTYLLIGALGFAAIGYMLFRGGRPTSQQKMDIPRVEVITTLDCPKCSLKRVRDFKQGDYVFKSDEPCTRCDGIMIISRINRKKEPEKEKKQGIIE